MSAHYVMYKQALAGATPEQLESVAHFKRLSRVFILADLSKNLRVGGLPGAPILTAVRVKGQA